MKDAVIGGNLNGKTLNPVIDFDFIVNSELGLIRFIRENFQDEKAFKLDILNKSDRDILSLLYSRSNYNPLSIISTEDNMSEIDELYNSFFTSYKQDIINRSTAEKEIIDFVGMVISSGSNLGINHSIAVRDDIEKKEIYDHFNKAQVINKSDIDIILSKDPYYIRDYRFFTENHLENKIIHKKIYMQPRQYNKDYFEDTMNALTVRNELVLMGKSYHKK